MTDVDIDTALHAVEQLMESGTAASVPAKAEKPKKPAGYDVYASYKSAAEGTPDSRVDSLDKLLSKISASVGAKTDLMSVTVHYGAGVYAVGSARAPSKSAVKLLAKLAGRSELATLQKADADKMGTFVMSKNKIKKAVAASKASKKIEKKAPAEKKAKPARKAVASAAASEESVRERIEGNLKKLQKKQKEKAV